MNDDAKDLIAKQAVRKFKVTIQDAETRQEVSTYVDLFMDDDDSIRKSLITAVTNALQSMGVIKKR